VLLLLLGTRTPRDCELCATRQDSKDSLLLSHVAHTVGIESRAHAQSFNKLHIMIPFHVSHVNHSASIVSRLSAVVVSSPSMQGGLWQHVTSMYT
jgi:hypothetical protein